MRRVLSHLWSMFGSIRHTVVMRSPEIDTLDRDAKRAVHAIDEQIRMMQGRT
jgi:hypothetical protein